MLDERTWAAVRTHMDLMRLAEFAETTIYARFRALIRLEQWAHRSLLDLTETDLMEWRRSLRQTAGTVTHYISHVHCFYAWAAEERLIDADPTSRIPAPKRGRYLPRPISEDDLWMAVHAARARIRPWLVLAAWCGLRAKEVALLDRSNVLDTAATPVLVVASNATKGRRERVVPLCEFAIRELHTAGLPQRGPVFTRRDGQYGPNEPHTISELTNKHLHDLGLTATFHTLRHRFLSQAYWLSHDLRLCQELAGHADPATTAGYAAINPTDAANVVSRLDVPPSLYAVAGGR